LLGSIDDILCMVITQDENGMCPVKAVQLIDQFSCNGRREVWAALPW
jgi:hypothetical protein